MEAAMLFPQLAGKACSYLNLNDVARIVRGRTRTGNPFLDPKTAQHHIDTLHKIMDVGWSYGGYMERRELLWEGVPYLEQADTFLHLGVDFNVPAGTEVRATAPCTVLKIDSDVPDEYGWGTRIIVRWASRDCLIFAHLRSVGSNKVGTALGVGDLIGVVGAAPENGGWFPHLHVQAISAEWWNYLKRHPGALRAMDGYGRLGELDILAPKYPDPLPYLRLWG